MEKNEYFISHCSDDAEIMKNFSELYHAICENPKEFFNTNENENDIDAGNRLSSALKEHLREAALMIAMITDNYLRSVICLAELSSFWYKSEDVGNRLIPIVFNGKSGSEVLKRIFAQEIIYVDANEAPMRAARKLIKAMEAGAVKLSCSHEEAVEKAAAFFENSRQAEATRPFIGDGGAYENIVQCCNASNICRVTNSGLGSGEMIEHLKDCREIYILATTGGSLITALTAKFIPAMLAQGSNLTVLIPNKYSDFCNDVAEIEVQGEEEANANILRFANEFSNVATNLQNAVRQAALESETGSIGKVWFGCAHTYLRQTITMGIREDGSAWGWLSVTLPPQRTNATNLSMEFTGRVSDEKAMAHNAYQHIRQIRDISERRNTLREITADREIGIDFSFKKEMKSAKQYWTTLFQQAKDKMAEKQGTAEDELIEVAAQHPLKKDGMPGLEFRARLDYAAELYRGLKGKEKDVKIYVPGSLHEYKGKCDAQSLSASGKKYLLRCGIPEEDILGEETNQAYKGEDGVYNSADECYVASRIFDEGDYSHLHCVCSPNQMMRKQLFYLAFGILPYFYTVPCDNMAHNLIYEVFDALPDVLMNDHTWQSEGSVNGRKTREERCPGYHSD